jgi:D-3-phosphoglycerate dehydrogenase
MRVLVADKFQEEGLQQIKVIASEVECDPALKGDSLKGRVAEFRPHVLVVRSTKVPADVIAASDCLKLIIRAGSGYDNIDLAAASRGGISVANCPGMNAAAVAELTLGLIIALDRRIPDNVIDLRAGKWDKKGYSRARGLRGRTLGILGAGKIGTEVARRALGFEMNILFTHLGRNRRLVDFPNCERTDVDELLKRSDYITIHVPGGDDTQKLIGEPQLKLMKPTACLINTSRASVVDEAALIQALNEGRIAGAAVDVYEDEPPADGTEFTAPIKDAAHLYGTHHIGASTEEAQDAVADEVVRIIKEYKASGDVLNCVNQTRTEAACLLIIRLANKPGSLAHVFQQLAADQVNVEEMDHVVYSGGEAAAAHIRLSRQPTDQTLNAIRNSSQVLGMDVMAAD